MTRYFVTGGFACKTLMAAKARAHSASRRRPAVQIAIRGATKTLHVYLNGKELPRSAWFAGYK